MKDEPARPETTIDADIVEQINAACVGHPHARIPWPHRLLHDARSEIERLRHVELAAGNLDRYALVIESAVREADPANLDGVTTAFIRLASVLKEFRHAR